MKFLDRTGKEINEGDFVVYVTTAKYPVLEFAWVVKFHETRDSYDGRPSGNFKIKLQRSNFNGVRQTKTVVDVAGHWRPDTPPHVMDYRLNNFKSPTREERDEFYVHTTYRDSGKPDTTMLDIFEGNNNRIMVTQPV